MKRFKECMILALGLASLLCMHGCQISAFQKRGNSLLKPPRHADIYVIAHRGAHNGIPENSIPAYQKAIELDADFVEVDIRTSSDGHLISIHNSTVDAYVAGMTGSVSDLTLAELRELDIGKRLGPQWEGTRVPTFEEILDLCKGRIGIYLDLKDASIPPLVELIKERGMERDIIWCLGDRTDMQTLIECCSDCILMPDPGDLEEFAVILNEFSPTVVAPVWREFTRKLVNMSHEAGALVFVDEQNETSWEQALEWGADGIQTDHPAALIAYLKHRRLSMVGFSLFLWNQKERRAVIRNILDHLKSHCENQRCPLRMPYLPHVLPRSGEFSYITIQDVVTNSRVTILDREIVYLV